MITTEVLPLLKILPSIEPETLFAYFLLTLMRLTPIVVLAPFLGARLPNSVKVGLALSIAIILLPTIVTSSATPVLIDLHFFELCVKELLIGFILGFLSTIPFYIAESSGILIDHMRGSASIMAMDPLMQTQVSPIGILYNWLLVVLFFELNGPFLFFDALFTSYVIIPVDSFFQLAFFQLKQPFWQLIASIMTYLLTAAIQLSAPAIVGIIMADMFLGIANRLAPQVQIAFLGISIKSMLGLGLLCIAWFFILRQLGHQSIYWMKGLLKVVNTFG